MSASSYFCHYPVLRESSTPAHLLWNHETVRQILEAEPSVAVWFNGHDHQGGYAERNGIHYVMFPGMVESGEQNAYTVVNVYADRLELDGTGSHPTRTLRIRRWQAEAPAPPSRLQRSKAAPSSSGTRAPRGNRA